MNDNQFIYLATQPLFLNSTRVRRTYLGGKNIDALHGVESPKDSEQPEEWIASVVEARNPGFMKVDNEGMSEVLVSDKDTVLLSELIHSNPELFLGEKHASKYGKSMAVLVKLIDSMERLTIQVHPDKEFARNFFKSEFGKTEAWYIVGTRTEGEEEPYLLLGFREGVTREVWKGIFDRQDIPAMLDCLHKIKPYPGDTYLIEGGVPHAIGPGCFLIEVQEPTDFTLRTERKTPSGNSISELLIHQGVGLEKLFDCFNYQDLTFEQTIARWKIEPQIIRNEGGGMERLLIGEKSTQCFRMHEIEVTDRYKCSNEDSFSVLFVLSGNGVIIWADGRRLIREANQLFLPISLNSFTLCNSGDKPLKLIRCFPPSIS